ncbi:MAG: membrane protein insertion efficiency factor YidD [Gammaproteobacteria bacterium RIFCSPHIGHO2_12_FULL_41_20]|nr:MAG: membrane protein insertion efficiency factor YidD [Gammaproteobacteria bacterium RIFCSPHIGHO2_12_FULL_41_20]
MEKINRSITVILIFFIQSYQWMLRPLIGQHCRFYPSCSSYAIEAIERQGWIKGIFLIIYRLSRCHPWCKGGSDPVPKK